MKSNLRNLLVFFLVLGIIVALAQGAPSPDDSAEETSGMRGFVDRVRDRAGELFDGARERGSSAWDFLRTSTRYAYDNARKGIEDLGDRIRNRDSP